MAQRDLIRFVANSGGTYLQTQDSRRKTNESTTFCDRSPVYSRAAIRG